jgi:hypothetical protein
MRHSKAGGNPANPEVLGAGHEQSDIRESFRELVRNAQDYLASRDLILMRSAVQTLEVGMTLSNSALDVVYFSRLGIDTVHVFRAGPKQLWCVFMVHGVLPHTPCIVITPSRPSITSVFVTRDPER